MIKLTKTAIRSITNGKIFSVTFKKKDGSLRKMRCRLEVKSHLKGGKSPLANLDTYLTVFDMDKRAYRAVNLETIERFKCGGVELTK